MMTKKLVFNLLLVFVVFLPIEAIPEERILLFDSDITIHTDGKIAVTEKITVNVTGKNIKHGIFREFPTKYRDRWDCSHNVGFFVHEVCIDSVPAQHRIKNCVNGQRIYIGDPQQFIFPGIHTFTIAYTTNRQLGFFESYDELYWNVTGLGWLFFIERATATVRLPKAITEVINKVSLCGYTGYQGEHGTSYQSFIDENKNIKFETTEGLQPHQGLTIVVAWPKGLIFPPSSWQVWSDFFHDNAPVFWLLVIFFLLLFFYSYIYFKKCAFSGSSTIIPLYDPPRNISAGAVYYLKNFKYDSKALTAEIVDMARAGYCDIECKKKFWSDTYNLNAKLGEEQKFGITADPLLHQRLYNILFKEKTSISLASDKWVIREANRYLNDYFTARFDGTYVKFFSGYLLGGVVFALMGAAYPMLFLLAEVRSLPVIIFAGACVSICVFFGKRFKAYTQEGKKIRDQIDGFKMFLEISDELERMKIIGTPPDRTPELYEKYLPYAIALGVEEQWSMQFAPLFMQMREQGISYYPHWYIGSSRGHSFTPCAFSSNLSDQFHGAVASSSSPSGWSSGSSGGGCSGGGGGGGGGGGW